MAKQIYRVDSPVIGKIHAYFESQAAAVDGGRDVAESPSREDAQLFPVFSRR